MNELKSCPCCGGEAKLNIEHLMLGNFVECINPNCQLTGRSSGDVNKAINAWNTRHIPEGMALVPIKSTEAMMNAFDRALENAVFASNAKQHDGWKAGYKAMIKAAEEK